MAHAKQQKQYEADRDRTAAAIHTKAEDFQPEKVNSVYKPTKPHVELKTVKREEFWSKMNEEEKLWVFWVIYWNRIRNFRRQEEEKTAREQAHKQFEADRQRMASEIHSKTENYQPDKVTSVYKPTKPHVEISSSAREEFWSKMNEEEQRRQAEEKEAQAQKQKEFETDRKRIADDLHGKAQISDKPVPSSVNPAPAPAPTPSAGLVGSRKELFSSKPSGPVLPKPQVNGSPKKWPPVGTTSPPREPVNRLTEPDEPSTYTPKPIAYEPEPMVYKPEAMSQFSYKVY